MEGEYTNADILLTVDVARLIRAKNKGLFKKVESDILQKKSHLIIEIKKINGLELVLRARIFVYHEDRVSENELKGYLSLMDSNGNQEY